MYLHYYKVILTPFFPLDIVKSFAIVKFTAISSKMLLASPMARPCLLGVLATYRECTMTTIRMVVPGLQENSKKLRVPLNGN